MPLPLLLTRAGLKALPWGKVAVVLAVLLAFGALVAWHVHRVDKARAEGEAIGEAKTQLRCAADTLARERMESKRAAGNRERADAESLAHEAVRATLEHELQESRDAARKALQRPIRCPAGQTIAVGDVVVPGDALGRLRRAAGGRPRAD